MVLVQVNQLYVLCILVGISLRNTLATDECPIPNDGKTGSKSSVTLSLHYCAQATSSSQPACLHKPSSQKLLPRGQVVDLQYDVNGYAVTAKYFGEEVCVAYRKVSIFRNARGLDHTDECESECFKYEETETYKSNIVCSSISCGGGRDKLKFVVTNSAGVCAGMSSVVLIISSVALLSFHFVL